MGGGGGTGRAVGGGMDPIFFTLKRSYYATLRLTRRMLAAAGLTAARFDLLDAIYRLGTSAVICQSHLRIGLGVARSTISRMMMSLERLGLVARRRVGRECIVALTPEGRRRVRRAFFGLVLTGHVALALDSALTPSTRHWPAQDACLRARDRLAALCMRIRLAFGDGATLDRATWCGFWREREGYRARARQRAAERRERALAGAYT